MAPTDLLDRLLDLAAVDGRLDVRCELAPGWQIDEAARAEREMPYHVLLAGTAVIDGPGLPPTPLGPGDVALLTAGGAHRLRQAGAADAGGLLCGRFIVSTAAWALFRTLLPPLIVVRAAGTDDAQAGRRATLVALLKAETDTLPPGSAGVLRHLSAALFGLSLRGAVHGPEPAPGLLALAAHPRLQGVVLGVLAEPGGAWSIEDMAERAHLSRSSLIRTFQAAASVSPAAFLTAVRMAEAARRLRDTHESVAAIGEAVGYASEAAFQRAFKRETQLTPAAWRARPADEPAPQQAPVHKVVGPSGGGKARR
ncbi:AraC family transcriptional regulator [Aquincola sp. MAHUQ-54]|uniref:AraC family transcriptional regulator n=1 Tax=Aquincola agrisoli TaxID=3119538 RepID=A0AAW9Q4R0_9BURK